MNTNTHVQTDTDTDTETYNKMIDDSLLITVKPESSFMLNEKPHKAKRE